MPAKGSKTEKTLKILELINKGLTNSEICKEIDCKQHQISQLKARNNLYIDKRSKYNWDEVQKFYNDGHTLKQCSEKFGMCQASFFKAAKRGLFKARLAADSLRMFYKDGGNRKPTSEETKQKLREKIASKVENGTWHYSFSKVRTHELNSKFVGKVKLMGMWEYEYAKYLDDNNIEWRRPKEKFYYEFEGLKSGKGYYIPDFFLVKENTYIEIKGYETDKDRAKWKWFPKDLKHKVLKRQDLLDLGLKISNK